MIGGLTPVQMCMCALIKNPFPPIGCKKRWICDDGKLQCCQGAWKGKSQHEDLFWKDFSTTQRVARTEC